MIAPRIAAGLSCCVFLFFSTLHADVPPLINYQGRVVVGVTNFDGTGQFKFALLDGSGIVLWRNHGVGAGEPANAVPIAVTKGLYSVLLGDTTLSNMAAIPPGVFDGPDVRLRVWFNDGINGSQQLAPDQRIAAVGYAMTAGTATTVRDGSITSAKIAAGAVGSTQLAAGAVGRVQLADSSVSTAKIVFGAVGAPQLAPEGVSGELWTPTAITGAPSARSAHTAIWTGSEMIVWGGSSGASALNDGGRYNPALNTWTAINTVSAPAGRASHTAVWTGSEMIVWGGRGSGNFNSGGRYNPSSDSWMATSVNGAPVGRRSHTAVWTGSEMIVWGGRIGGGFDPLINFGDGARYNPTSDSWTFTNPSAAPIPRSLHTAVWTGTLMVIWGGFDTGALDSGSRYNPVTDAWAATNPSGALSARSFHTAAWTGTQMVLFGGLGADAYNDGAIYDPVSNAWTAIANSAAARYSHTAVWAGSDMVVWGGVSTGGGALNTSERYRPSINTWSSLNSAPLEPRTGHTAIWSGAEMIIWGGGSSFGSRNGARLRLSTIAPGSIGSGQLVIPLQINSSNSGSTLSGANSAASGTGVSGISTGGGSGIGVSGVSSNGNSGIGIFGNGGTGTGVKGVASGIGSSGVIGESLSGFGVVGSTDTGTAILGIASGSSGHAGIFNGNFRVAGGSTFSGSVVVTGSLSKGGGSFRIDHPLEPARKYLSHSFVESPDMMNIYNGNAILDDMGEAVITLPEWFSALNKKFRYQLTCLGRFAPVYIAEEITENRFKIAGGERGLKVSWQVTGVRQDAWANANRILVEEEKPATEIGSYLHPELFGQPAEKGVEWAREPALVRDQKARKEAKK